MRWARHVEHMDEEKRVNTCAGKSEDKRVPEGTIMVRRKT
jgi:hypothetical protein